MNRATERRLHRGWSGISGLGWLFLNRDVVCALQFLEQDALLRSVDSAGRVDTWDLGAGKRIESRKPPRRLRPPLALSPNGQLVVGRVGDGAVLWRLADGTLVPLGDRNDGLWSVAFSPDSRVIAVGDCVGRCRTFSVEEGSGRADVDFGDRIDDVVFSGDGRLMLCASFHDEESQVFAAWDVDSGRQLFTSGPHQGEVESLACARRGAPIWTAGRGIDVLEPESSSTPRVVLPRIVARQIKLSPDGRRLFGMVWETSRNGSLRDGSITVLDATSQRVIGGLGGLPRRSSAMAVSAAGNRVAVAGESAWISVVSFQESASQ